MKAYILGLFCLVSCSCAFPNDYQVRKSVEDALSNIQFNVLPKELVEKLSAQFKADEQLSAEDISVTINEYSDAIFNNLRNYINNHNLNDMDIPDAHLSLKPTGHIDLKNGHLQDLNTIARGGDIVVVYSADNKKINLALPIKFGDLKFSYDYHTKALLISISGGVHGSIQNVNVHADLSFDFNTYQAFLDHYDMKDSGKVSLKFTGNGLVDWLTNAMSSVVSTFLGQVIVNVAAKVIRENLRALVEDINNAINQIIHP